MLTLTVAICTYFKTPINYLKKLKNALDGQTDSNFEILVIADGNDDFFESTKKVFSNNNVKQVSFQNLCLSRNFAIEKTNTDLLAFIDDDAYPKDNWVEQLKESFKAEKVFGVGGPIHPKSEKEIFLPYELNWIIGCTYFQYGSDAFEIRNPIGCNMAVRTKYAKEMGGFTLKYGKTPKILIAGDETDFFMRLHEIHLDGSVIFNPYAEVYHRVHPTRLTGRYLRRRSYFEGVTKRLMSKQRREGIDTEGSFTKSLIFRSIPRYTLNILKLKNIVKNVRYIFSIKICLISAGMGFLFAPIVRRKMEKQD